MNITLTGRHLEITPSLREYAEKKIKKLVKYFHQLIDVHIILYVEKVDHVAEVVINGDGSQFHGHEKAGDMYSAIDLLVDKMEKQIVKFKEKHSGHKAVSPSKGDNFQESGRIEEDIIFNKVSDKPVEEVEAFLEMRMDKKDFILFKKGTKKVESGPDATDGNYAVIYRSGESHKMAEIPAEMIKRNNYDQGDFIEYDLQVLDDSASSPKIKFKKSDMCGITRMTVTDAIEKMKSDNRDFLPFFNLESRYINVLYKNGSKIGIMVPSK